MTSSDSPFDLVTELVDLLARLLPLVLWMLAIVLVVSLFAGIRGRGPLRRRRRSTPRRSPSP